MNLSLLLLASSGIALSLAAGLAFSAMGSAALAQNRARLMALFGDEQPEPTSEQEIFRETKDIYFLSRLGLCLSLIGAEGGALAVAVLLSGHTPVGRFFQPDYLLVGAALIFLLLPPLYLICVFGLPFLLPRQAPDDAEMPRWMRGLMRLARPVARVARLSALPRIGRSLPRHHLTKNDLVALVTELDLSEEEDDFEEEHIASPSPKENDAPVALEPKTNEDEIIYNILDLEKTLVREVMKPINSVVAMRISTATVEVARRLARRTGYSRFPVYHDRIVELVGFVDIYDILNNDDASRPFDSFITPAYFVPEFMRVSDLLQEFLNLDRDAAVVIDEHGGSSGWITREDALEEIVGEIEDEFDARKRRLHQCEDGSYLADGAIDIDDLAEELPLRFDDDPPPYDTLAGFILMALGRIPAKGDRVETNDATFTVDEMEENRVARIRITLRPVRRRGDG